MVWVKWKTCACESFLDWLLHKCSMDVLIMFCSNMLTHWTRVEIVCAVLWCYGCVRFPLPYAKCKVFEDMQVARCLCNFPLERQNLLINIDGASAQIRPRPGGDFRGSSTLKKQRPLLLCPGARVWTDL